MKKWMKKLLAVLFAGFVAFVGLLIGLNAYMDSIRAPGGWLRVSAESDYPQVFGRAASNMTLAERDMAFMIWQYYQMGPVPIEDSTLLLAAFPYYLKKHGEELRSDRDEWVLTYNGVKLSREFYANNLLH